MQDELAMNAAVLILPVTASRLVNHGHIVRSSLVVLNPAAIHKGQAALIHQLFYLLLGFLRLLSPPSSEEGLHKKQLEEPG